MESPSLAVRRQAWVQGSRQWLTLEETEPQAQSTHLPPTAPSISVHPLHTDQEPPPEGCCAGKIESWLLGCGLDTGVSHLPVESVLRASYSIEDDLSLGAEATALHVKQEQPEMGSYPLLLPPPKAHHKEFTTSTSTPHQRLSPPSLHLGHSMASSTPTSSTSLTASSVCEVLQLCREDPEETLYHLGFCGDDDSSVTARIPPRFFSFPSALGGINFRLFLQSQLRRLRQEDPDLSLASRFRQVEVLTTMANAFYSLYSHVSRTPLQKLAPPEPDPSSPAGGADKKTARFLASVRSEPRSPVERLKDTVSKMCLYTGGSSQRWSDSSSPQPSPKKRPSLPDLVDLVLENAMAAGGVVVVVGPENQAGSDTVQRGRTRGALDVCTNTDGDRELDSDREADPEESLSKGQEVWESVSPADRRSLAPLRGRPEQTEPGLNHSHFRYDQAEQVSSVPPSLPSSVSPGLPPSLPSSPRSSLSPSLPPSLSPRIDQAEPDSSLSPHRPVCDTQEHTRLIPAARVTYDQCWLNNPPTPLGHTASSEGELMDRSAVLSQRPLRAKEEQSAADEAGRRSSALDSESCSDCTDLGRDRSQQAPDVEQQGQAEIEDLPPCHDLSDEEAEVEVDEEEEDDDEEEEEDDDEDREQYDWTDLETEEEEEEQTLEIHPPEPKEALLEMSTSQPEMGAAGLPDFSSMTEEEQIAYAMQTSLTEGALPHLQSYGKRSPCRITVTGWEGDDVTPRSGAVTGWEGDDVTPCSGAAPASAAAFQITQHSDSCETGTFLCPVKSNSLGKQQANSFELEEVLSAGEEDFVQSENPRMMTLLQSTGHHKGVCPCPGVVVRGDSVQSDSSGYAEEDGQPSPCSSARQGS